MKRFILTVLLVALLATGAAAQQIPPAAQAYVKAIQLQPQNYVFLFNMGSLMYTANSYDNAATAFQKAIQIRPEDADCHYMLGKTYAQQGNIPASMREYNILQKLEPKLAKDLYRSLNL